MNKEEIEEILNSLGNENVSDEVRKIAKETLEKFNSTLVKSKRRIFWEDIMNSKVIKLAAAAVVIIAVTLGLYTIFNKSVTPAYAIEQTIKANEDVRYLRFKRYDPNAVLQRETWIQYDQNDNIQKIRVDMHDRWGEKVRNIVDVWSEGKTLVWDKEQGRLDLFDCSDWTAKMFLFVERYDPKQAVEHLYKMQEEGKVKIEMKDGANDESIRIMGQYLPGTYMIGRPDMPVVKDVLIIDPKTKLVTQIEVYAVIKDQMKFSFVYKDYDYQPFDPNIFDIEKQAPDNVERVDGSTFGLAQGNLTDNEIAVKLVREYLDAWINKDYAKTGNLYNGSSAAAMQKWLSKLNVVRAVSIGEPSPHSGPNSIRVPCVIEVERDGNVEQEERWFFISRYACYPDRWVITLDSYRDLEDIGLPKGDLTDDEISVLLVREFLEAAIENDYAKAGKLCNMSAAMLEERIKFKNIVRIISIDKPHNWPYGIQVPCTIEVEKDGKVENRQLEFSVHRVSGQQNRWMIDHWTKTRCE